MKSFNDDNYFFDSRRDRFLFRSESASTDSNVSRGKTFEANASVFSSFIDAFESRLNADRGEKLGARRGARRRVDRLGTSEDADRPDKPNMSDASEATKATEASSKFGARERRVRREVAKRFAEPVASANEFDVDVEARSGADAFFEASPGRDGGRESVEDAFRFDGPPDATATVDGKTYLYFGGDGFLGLQADPETLAAACEAALKYGLGSATSRRLAAAPIRDVERNAAKFFGVERAFYALNEASVAEAILDALAGSVERVFVEDSGVDFWKPILDKTGRIGGKEDSDEPSVAARRVRRTTPVPFRRADSVDLAEKLRLELKPGDRPIVVAEGVYGDDGTIAPLREYVDALAQYSGAALLVDDSRGLGTLGAKGRGTLEYWGFDFSCVNRTPQDAIFDSNEPFGDFGGFVETRANDGKVGFEGGEINVDLFGEKRRSETSSRPKTRLFMFASLAKAVGGFGCVAPGSEFFVEKLNESTDGPFASVPSNPIAAATARGLRILATTPEIRTRLRENAERLRRGLRRIGIDVPDSPSPIVSFRLGSQQNMRRIQRALASERILVSYLPARRDGALGTLRAAVFATHSPEAIDALVDALRAAL